MKYLFISISLILGFRTSAQSIKEIDSMRTFVLENKDQFESFRYSNKEISNEDAIRYDTIVFYNFKGQLIYIKRKERSHTFHLSGDAIDFTEIFVLNEKVIFKRSFGYKFDNPQWHLEPNINKVKVSIVESNRIYYNLDGNTIMEYKGRETNGLYQDRFTLLDSLPLNAVNSFIWEDRCDECFEKDYLKLFRALKEN